MSLIPLSSDQLVKCHLLPLKPSSVVLKGQSVILKPLVIERDLFPLFEMSNGKSIILGKRTLNSYDADVLIWRYLPEGPFQNSEALAVYLKQQVDAPDGLCMCVFDRETERQVGVTNFMSNQPAHLKIELGGIWYSPIVQRTGINIETISLMLQHVFDLGYRRVEWKCNAENERSRKAALKIGFTFEGIQESHMIVKGCNRDTAWFRILDTEWPKIVNP